MASVVATVECPSRSLTALALHRSAKSTEAWVCLIEWNVVPGGIPARLASDVNAAEIDDGRSSPPVSEGASGAVDVLTQRRPMQPATMEDASRATSASSSL